MSAHRPIRGGEPVGSLNTLPAADVAAIMLLRLWCDGENGRGHVRRALRDHLGLIPGRGAAKNLERLVTLCLSHGRRPLLRHGMDCRCAGADECWFARLLDAAAAGDREDAMMLVRADIAPTMADLAEQVGLSLRRLGQCASLARDVRTPAAGRVLH